MRILHICQRDDPDTGGSLRVAEALVRSQRAAGHDVWLLFLYGDPGHVCSSLAGQVVCLGLPSSEKAILGMFKLHAAILRIKPDIIHSHDGIVWPRLPLACLKTKVITHTHLPLGETGHPFSRWLIKSTSDLLIGISLHTIDTWVGKGYPPSQIHYIPNGVDLGRFHPVDQEAKIQLRKRFNLPVDKRVLLWVGRLHRKMKGLDRVERLVGLLPEDMVLVLVGNGPEYNAILERQKPFIEQGRIVLVGSVEAPENYYKVADAFLFTSYHEPFGLVILEAVACGLPIISFPVTEGGGAVQLLREFSAEEIEDAWTDEDIRQFLRRPETYGCRSAIDANVKKTNDKYAWKPISRRVVDIYKIALNKTL